MRGAGRCGRANTRLIVVLVLVVAAGAGGLWGLREYRRWRISSAALSQGLAAMERSDWPAAASQLHRYLEYHPKDRDILGKWTRANLMVQPPGPANLQAAIVAQRQLLVLDESDLACYALLARLYAAAGDLPSLTHVCGQWAARQDADTQAQVWLGRALIAQGQLDEAASRLQGLLDRLGPGPGPHDPACAQASVMLSAIAMQRDDPALAQRLVDEGIARDPQSPALLAQRARLSLAAAEQLSGPQRAEALAQARQSLAAGEGSALADPEAALLMVQGWAQLGELDKARSLLDALGRISPDMLREEYVDLRLWAIAKFLCGADLAVRSIAAGGLDGATATSSQPALGYAMMADDILAQVQDRAMRLRVLPAAVRLYTFAGNTDAARRALGEYNELILLLQEPADARDTAALLEATIALSTGQAWAALAIAEPITLRQGDNVLAWQLMAQACRQTHQPRREYAALAGLAQAARSDADLSGSVLARLAQAHLFNGRPEAAMQLAQQSQAIHPELAGRLRLLEFQARAELALRGPMQERRERVAAVVEQLERMRQEQPGLTQVHVLLADLAMAQGMHDQAQQCLQRATRECDDPYAAHIALASLYELTGRFAQAREAARAACELDPAQPTGWAVLARLAVQAGEVDQAEQALRSGLEAVGSQDREDLQVRLAALMLMQSRPSEATDLLTGAAQQQPQSIRVRSFLLNLSMGDPQASRALVDQIRQIEGPAGLNWRLHQTQVWLAGPDWRDHQAPITEYLGQCLQADPGWATPALLLSQVYERVGDLVRCEGVCRQALAANPSALAVADRLMSLLTRGDRASEAAQVLEQVSAAAGQISRRRLMLAMAEGDMDEAAAQLRWRLAQNPQSVADRILLARIVYSQTRSAPDAMALLEEAEALEGLTPAILAARAAIVEADQGPEAAMRLLDDYVAQTNSYDAHLLRATFLQRQGDLDAAQRDFLTLGQLSDQPAAYQALARFYMDSGRDEQAAGVLREAIARHPQSPTLQRDLVTVLLSRRQASDRAELEAMLAAMERQPLLDSFPLRARATYLLEMADPPQEDQAGQLLERAVAMDPSAVAAHEGLVGIAVRRGELARARELCLRGLGANPINPRLIALQARIELLLGNAATAGTLSRRALLSRGEDVQLLGVLAEAALLSGGSEQVSGALTAVEAALERHGTDWPLQLSRARLMIASGRVSQAAEHLSAYCRSEVGGRNVEAMLTASEVWRAAGQTDRAREWLDRASALAGDDPLVQQHQLRFLQATATPEQVAEQADRIAAREGAGAASLTIAAAALASQDDPALRKRAKEYYERALAHQPRSAAAQLGLAQLAYAAGDVGASEQLYRQVLEVDPANVQALNDLAWILSEDPSRCDEALRLADRGVELAPSNFHLRDTRGVILARLPDRGRDAQRDFERCLAVSAPRSRDQARALLQLARTLVAMDDFAGATTYLDQARQLGGTISPYTSQELQELDRLSQQCLARVPATAGER